MVFVLIYGLLAGVAALVWRLRYAQRARARAEAAQMQLAQERQQVVDFMHHMVQALGEGLSRQELMQRVVHAAILCSGALSACLFERRPDGKMHAVAVEGLFPPHRPLPTSQREKLSSRAHFIEQVLKSESFPDDEGVVGAVVQTRRGQLIVEAASDRRVVRHDDPTLRVQSVIAVPLLFRDQLFGVLAVANSADGQPFTTNDFSLMQTLAEQAALALHNAEFLHYQIEKKQLDLDLSLASSIQQMLLPREAPKLAGLDVDARYTAAQKVSGDFYDLFALSETQLAVAVADVSGKGIPASLLMAICRTNLRQIALRHASPAATLAELNQALGSDLQRGMFITILYAVIDTARGEVTLARAGHELPLLIRRSETAAGTEVAFVRSEGMPLGLVPDDMFRAVIADHTETLAVGDILVLYTDGLTEAPNEDGKEFAGSRLADAVQHLARLGAREINDGVLETLRRFTGTLDQRDDLTLVTVKRV